MKQFIVIVVFTAISILTFAQSPHAFKYQAVVRDNAGEIIANQAVSFRISIRDGSAEGTIVYQESHSATTNDFGLANLEIGNGTPVSGDFTAIDWSNSDKFLEIELDETGGINYVSMGTSQMLSVPFALYANEARAKEIADDDHNTRITAEENPDEDTLRFYVAGTEAMKHDGKTLHMTDPYNNVFIGNKAGESNVDGEYNVALGGEALKDNTTGDSNVAIGGEALEQNNAGNGNIAIGNRALFKNDNGFGNTALGSQAGYQNISGDNNVFIGKFAGYNETGNNKLYIENSQAQPENALIYGDFVEDKITLNADVGIGKINPEASLDIIGDIGLNSSPSTDQYVCGITSIEVVEQNDLGVGAALCLNSNGYYIPANASDYARLPCVALAVETGTGLHKVLHLGYLRNDNWNWNVPGLIYVEADNGNLTQQEHSGYSDINQIVGYAVKTNVIMFKPELSLFYKNNNPPVADFFTLPDQLHINEQITFNASGSYDPDVGDSIIQYEWDFNGDGSFEETGISPVTSYLYTVAGAYNAVLRVTDNHQHANVYSETLYIGCISYGTSCYLYYPLGTVCGDDGNDNLSIQNCGPDWFQVYMEECDYLLGVEDLNMLITLQSPPNMNYDLFVYDENCILLESSINSLGEEQIQITVEDVWGYNDSSYFRIEVRMISGTSNQYWTLNIQGNNL